MTLYKKIQQTFSGISFKDILESVSGTDQDFTSGGLGRALLLISIPMVLEMIMESIFALVDIYFVSKLGAAATAAVGITESIMTLVYSIAVGLSTAVTAVISRRIGEKNYKTASESAVQSIYLAIFFSVLIAIPGTFFARNILELMQASDNTILEGVPYIRIMLGSNIVIMFLFVINAIFRSSGDAAISFRVLALANLLNIVLDPCLIRGIGPFPELGVKGAAIATTIGRGIAVIYQIYLLFSGSYRIKINLKHLQIKWKVIFQIFKLSLGGIGQHIIAMSSWIILIRLLAGFGENIVAGYTVAIRIILFALLPSWGLSNAASTLVGQNLGAGKSDRAEKSIWLCMNTNIIFLGIITLFLVIVPDFFIGLIVRNQEIMTPAITCLRYVSYGFIMYGVGMIFMQSINGSGDTKTPTVMNIFCYWIMEVPLAILLANRLGLGPEGVYIAILMAEGMLSMIGYYLIKRGKWKVNVV